LIQFGIDFFKPLIDKVVPLWNVNDLVRRDETLAALGECHATGTIRKPLSCEHIKADRHAFLDDTPHEADAVVDAERQFGILADCPEPIVQFVQRIVAGIRIANQSGM
jgi:hypothetical protein